MWWYQSGDEHRNMLFLLGIHAVTLHIIDVRTIDYVCLTDVVNGDGAVQNVTVRKTVL